MNFTLHLPVNQAVQLDLTGLLKSVDRLIDMVGSVFRTKVIRYFHQGIIFEIEHEIYLIPL